MHYSNNYHIAVETAIERNLLLREPVKEVKMWMNTRLVGGSRAIAIGNSSREIEDERKREKKKASKVVSTYRIVS